MVTCSVCGIRFTSNTSPSTRFTVRLTPSMQIEPLAAMYLASALGVRTPTTVPFLGGHLADAVHVAGDQVAAELAAQGERLLQVDRAGPVETDADA